jgi:hypothetical protein
MTPGLQAENPHRCLRARPDNNALKQTVGVTVFFTERRVYFDLSSRPLLSFSFGRHELYARLMQCC